MDTEPEQIGVDSTDERTMSFLESVGHGVLSMGKDDTGYGIPVSFGYDETEDRFLFEFLNIGESKKEEFANATAEVTLTVYEYDDPDTWESAIVTGTINEVNAADLSERAVSSFSLQGEDGAEQIRWEGSDQLERKWYEIDPTSITGRHRETAD